MIFSQEFLFELEGAQTLRFLLYEDIRKDAKTDNSEIDNNNRNETNERIFVLRGKASLELAISCVSNEFKFKEISISDVGFSHPFHFPFVIDLFLYQKAYSFDRDELRFVEFHHGESAA